MSSVISEDVRPLVNSETLPSVNPVNLLGASSFAVRADNASRIEESLATRLLRPPRRARSPRRTSSRRATNERTKQRLTSFTIQTASDDPRSVLRFVRGTERQARGWYAALDQNAVLDGIPGAGPPARWSTSRRSTHSARRSSSPRRWRSTSTPRRGAARLQVQTEPASGVHQRRLRMGRRKCGWRRTGTWCTRARRRARATAWFSGLRQLEWLFDARALLLVQNLRAYAFAALPRRKRREEHARTSSDGQDAGAEVFERASTKTRGYVPVNRAVLIAVDILMLMCGLVMPLTSGTGSSRSCSSRWSASATSSGTRCALLFCAAWRLRPGRLVPIAALKFVAWAGALSYFATGGACCRASSSTTSTCTTTCSPSSRLRHLRRVASFIEALGTAALVRRAHVQRSGRSSSTSHTSCARR